MANPPILVRRGTGWPNTLWAQQEQAVEQAVRHANRGLECLGINYNRPKHGSIRRYAPGARGDDVVGMAFDAVNFGLYEELSLSALPRKARHAATWSTTIVHEVVHCARFERVARDDCVELAATEGLAHVAEYEYTKKFFGKLLVTKLFDFDLEHPNYKLQKGLETIAAASQPTDQHYEWYSGKTAHGHMRDGDIYGSQCIWQRLQEGFTLPHLMRRPAEELLGL
jgi:hypothetical protein